MSGELRLGIMLDGELVPAWVARWLERLAAHDELRVELLLAPSAGSAPSNIEVLDWDGAGRGVGWSSWRALERRLSPATAALFELRAVPDVLRGVTRLTIPSEATAAAAPLAMLRHLRQLGLDVLLQFGLAEWAVPLSGVARQGIWRLRSGAPTRGRRGPPGYWEVVRGEGETTICVERLEPERLAAEVLAEGAFTTDATAVLGNRAAHIVAGGELLLRELRLRARLDDDAWRRRIEARQLGVVPALEPQGVRPSLLGAAAGFARVQTRALVRRLVERVRPAQWVLAYSFASRDSPDLHFERFTRILPPRDRIWADPFVLHRRGRWYVFFEDMPITGKRGVLACFELRADGGHTEPRVVLERPYHLSYPQVFEHGGNVYLLPETHEARRVELYRAAEFPWRWEPVATLLDDIEMVDATLVEHGERWWLFGTARDEPGTTLQDALHVYSADALLGGVWQRHIDNPVVIDATSARPAGPFWRDGGVWYRPSQDSSHRYGYGLCINEVQQLDDAGYRERCVRRVAPDWDADLLGVHTLSFAGGLTLIDLLRRGTG